MIQMDQTLSRVSIDMSNRPNLYPHLWGPHGWFFLDNIVFSYPTQPSSSDKILFRDFFTSY